MSIFFDDEAQLSGTDSGDEEESLLSQDLDFIDLSTEDDSPSLYRAFDNHSSPSYALSQSSIPEPTRTEPSDSSDNRKRAREEEHLTNEAPKKQDTKKFRLQSKTIFLTFPQCDYPLDDFFANLRARFPDLNNQIYCSREQHETGEWHLHAVILLHKKLDTQNVRFFDDLVLPPKHPNIESKIRSRPQTISYVMKGPDDSLKRWTHPWRQFLQLSKDKKSTKALQIMEIIETMDLSVPSHLPHCMDRIDQEIPGYLLLHHHQVRDYLQYRHQRTLRHGAAEALKILVRVRPALTPLISSNVSIANWINSAIRIQRPHRSRQMWIKAPPGAGKTTMISNLETWFKLRVYWWPRDEAWWDGYEDGAYDLIVLDEFKSQKKITELNPILSGDTVPLSRRRAPPYVKRENLPVIILSNYLPEECFHRCTSQALAPLLDRLEIVEVSNYVRIERVEEEEIESV